MSHFELSVKSTKTHLAKELGIARSSLYYRHKQSAKDWQTKIKIEETLSDRICHSYGHKRLARHLKINKKRVLRVMKSQCPFPFAKDSQCWMIAFSIFSDRSGGYSASVIHYRYQHTRQRAADVGEVLQIETVSSYQNIECTPASEH